jgi:hypothetical protein
MNPSDPVRTVPEAFARIDASTGSQSNFALSVHESMLDPIGVNMALITDRILEKGWEPDGFTAQDGYRVFHYRALGALDGLRSEAPIPDRAALISTAWYTSLGLLFSMAAAVTFYFEISFTDWHAWIFPALAGICFVIGFLFPPRWKKLMFAFVPIPFPWS